MKSIAFLNIKTSLCYVRNYKVASSFLVRHLMGFRHPPSPSPSVNIHSGVTSHKIILNDKDIFLFTFVRNPYVRLLSAYIDRVSRSPMSKKENINSFEDFVNYISIGNNIDRDIHWAPQIKGIGLHHSSNVKLCYNFIGRIERFSIDMNNLLEMQQHQYKNVLDMINNPKHLTHTSSLIEKYYTPSIERIVYELYHDDFETFGYYRSIDNCNQVDDTQTHLPYETHIPKPLPLHIKINILRIKFSRVCKKYYSERPKIIKNIFQNHE